LAEAALASYWKGSKASEIFTAAGLRSEPLDENGTDCYVAWNDGAAIVAFRGTQPDEWQDILADAKARQHRGFADAIEGIWPALSARLEDLSSTRTVWFCGHSLGAALATLAAYRYERTSGVCTLGCPRVGDRTFTAAFRAKLGQRSLRYVNDHDVVTHVPPPEFLEFTYDHVQFERFIDADGQVSPTEPRLSHFFSDLIGRPSALLEHIQVLLGSVLTITPVFLLDHMPKAYAIWMWNDYDANG
jgi:triacylglycerol lipase